MNREHSPVSRRAMIAGLGVSAGAVAFGERPAGAVTVPMAPHFAAAPVRNALPLGIDLLGRADIALGPSDFRPAISGVVTNVTAATLTVDSTTVLVASFAPRAGDVVASVTVYLEPAATSGAVSVVKAGVDGTSTVLKGATYAATTGATSVTLDLPANTVAGGASSGTFAVTVALAPNAVLYGAAVTVFSPASELVLIDPIRVWDSRTTAGTTLVPGATAGGRISSGTTRGLTVDGAITRGASALLLNVTLDQTAGSGYLTFYAENPDDPTPPPVSSINWYAANQIVANLVVTGMAGEADVTIVAGGGGSTHYIVDVLGFYL